VAHGIELRVDPTAGHPGEHIGPVRMRKVDNPAVARAEALRQSNEAAARDPEQVLAALTRNNATFTERGTTEFQPIVTKIAQSKPDIVDLGGAPPADIGLVFKELAAQGWRGIKVASAGTGADAMVKTGGSAVEGVYMPIAADFSGPTASPVQRRLDQEARKRLGEPLSPPQIAVWDTMMALKAGIEKADSIDPRAIAKVLPELVFESSYGPTVFGGSEVYGSPQQMLVPIIVTEIKDGAVSELKRVSPAELKKRLGKS